MKKNELLKYQHQEDSSKNRRKEKVINYEYDLYVKEEKSNRRCSRLDVILR